MKQVNGESVGSQSILYSAGVVASFDEIRSSKKNVSIGCPAYCNRAMETPILVEPICRMNDEVSELPLDEIGRVAIGEKRVLDLSAHLYSVAHRV